LLIAILADLHANLEATIAVLDKIRTRSPDVVLCLGDLTGYYANPNEVLNIVRECGAVSVLGNHDAAVCGLEEPYFFRTSAKAAINWQRQRLHPDNHNWLLRMPKEIRVEGLALAVHGSPHSRNEYLDEWLDTLPLFRIMDGLLVCLFGHTHKPTLFAKHGENLRIVGERVHRLDPGNFYFINPGAVGQPRDGDPRAAFGLLDSTQMTFEFCRAEYDVRTCADKAVKAGLPAELAQRLEKGK